MRSVCIADDAFLDAAVLVAAVRAGSLCLHPHDELVWCRGFRAALCAQSVKLQSMFRSRKAAVAVKADLRDQRQQQEAAAAAQQEALQQKHHQNAVVSARRASWGAPPGRRVAALERAMGVWSALCARCEVIGKAAIILHASPVRTARCVALMHRSSHCLQWLIKPGRAGPCAAGCRRRRPTC